MTGQKLREKRLELSLTQEQLAEGLGVDRNTVARWERGERSIPPYLELAINCMPGKKEKGVKPPKNLASRNKTQ